MSFSTSRVWATSVSQLPTWLMICPVKNSRKLRYFSELKVEPPKRANRPFGFSSNFHAGGSPTEVASSGGGGEGTSRSLPRIG